MPAIPDVSPPMSLAAATPVNVVVSITYNALSHDILDAFFASLRDQRDADFVMLIIDNASNDGTADYLRANDFPDLRLILNDENVGFGRACNQGIEFARQLGATTITFINNDVEFQPDLIGGMIRSLETTGAAALAPLIVPFDQPDTIWFVHGSFRWERGLVPHHDWIWQPRGAAPRDRIQPTTFVTGCCVIVSMSVFDKLGGFDDRFFVYWEDADLSMRMLQHGFSIIVDTDLVCRHKISITTGGSFSAFSVFHATRGHLLFVRKHYHAVVLGFVIPVIIAKMILNVARLRMRLSVVRSWAQGLRAGLRD